jgi:hypothetical protein
MDRRRARIAENEVRFRDINERLRQGVEALIAADEAVDFVCECGQAACTLSVPLTTSQYESVRTDARTFVVREGHEIPDVEAVVANLDGYSVVRKHEDAAPYVRARDPRA